MVVTLLLASASTFFQAYLQVFATKTVNAVTKTQHLDSGEFWLLPIRTWRSWSAPRRCS